MGRSGYVDDCDDDYPYALSRQACENAIRGKRGQAFLREMAAALDAMPVKELIADEIVSEEGQACAIGTVALARGVDVSKLDPYDYREVAKTFRISESLARDIAYENDDDFNYKAGPKEETPADRWKRMRRWIDANLTREPAPTGSTDK